jgi:hypothetical protein
MSNILISIWVFLIIIYAIRTYIGNKIISNIDLNIIEVLFPRGFTSILYLRLLNLKKLRGNTKISLFGVGFNILTYVIYGLLITNFFVILFKDSITINH